MIDMNVVYELIAEAKKKGIAKRTATNSKGVMQ